MSRCTFRVDKYFGGAPCAFLLFLHENARQLFYQFCVNAVCGGSLDVGCYVAVVVVGLSAHGSQRHSSVLNTAEIQDRLIGKPIRYLRRRVCVCGGLLASMRDFEKVVSACCFSKRFGRKPMGLTRCLQHPKLGLVFLMTCVQRRALRRSGPRVCGEAVERGGGTRRSNYHVKGRPQSTNSSVGWLGRKTFLFWESHIHSPLFGFARTGETARTKEGEGRGARGPRYMSRL